MLRNTWRKFKERLMQAATHLWRRYLLPDYEQFKDRYGAVIADSYGWLEGQSPKIHRAIKFGSLLILILSGYLLLWMPLRSMLDGAETSHQMNARTLSYLRQNPPVYNDDGDQSLATILINSARSSGIVFSQFQPSGGDGVSIAIEGVGMELLLAWLENLEQLGVARIDNMVISDYEDDQDLIVRLTLVGL